MGTDEIQLGLASRDDAVLQHQAHMNGEHLPQTHETPLKETVFHSGETTYGAQVQNRAFKKSNPQ